MDTIRVMIVDDHRLPGAIQRPVPGRLDERLPELPHEVVAALTADLQEPDRRVEAAG